MKTHLLIFALAFFYTINAFTQGTTCSNPITATADSNNEYTFAQYAQQWYSYTATQDGKIVLENLATDAYSWVDIYSDCENNIAEGYNGISFACTNGQTYYIAWYNNYSANFYWSLTEEDALNGEFCSQPVSATADSNNEHTLGQYENQWYSYTAIRDGKIILENLATDADSYVEIFTDCDTYYYMDGYNSVTFQCTSGQTYYIQWYNYNTTNFNWSLSEEDLVAGDACSIPIIASADSNNEHTFGQYANQWYSYTATLNGKMTLQNLASDADSYVSIYTDCEYYYGDYDYNGITYEVTAGVTYYIKWENDNSTNFYWSLSEEAYIDGEICSMPIAATADSNNQHTFGQYTSQWYSYTATQDGKIVLTNLATDASSNVYIYTDCDYYLDGGSDKLTYEITSGVTYYIRWYNYNTTDFYWSLSEEDLIPGDACSIPVAATADSNNEHNFGEYNYQWYSYTATQDGKIVLTNLATDADSYVEVYTECDNYIIWGATDTQFESTAGQTYQIVWYNYNSTNFYWSLSEQALDEGDACSMPIAATEDSNNQYTLGLNAYQWYSYTATTDGKIILQNLDDNAYTYVYIYTDCDYYYYENGYNGITYDVAAGVTYYIKWYNYYSTNFYWSLTEEPYVDGDACTMPIPATADSNNQHTFGQYNYQWYSYTATMDGKMVLENLATDASSSVTIFTDCNSYSYDSGTNGVSFEITSGVTYYIRWNNYNSTNFYWSLSEENLEAGDACSIPIPATTDSNNEHTFGESANQWYSYTASQDGKIVLTNLATDADSYVEIYTDCDYYISWGVNSIQFESTAGQTYYIVWYNYNSTNFYWSLSENQLESGDACSTPTPATADNNNQHTLGEYYSQWYSYTATRDGKIVIETLDTEGYAEFYIYTDCNTYLDYGNNMGSFESTNGQTYYIEWINYNSSNFYWSLSEEDIIPGDVCSMPLTAVLGNNTADNSKGDQWFAYTPAENVTLVISSCDLTEDDTYFELYSECGNYGYMDYSDDDCEGQSYLIFNADAGTTYYIRWTNYYTSSSFTWNLSIDDPNSIETGENYGNKVRLYPNPATDMVFIDSELPIEYIRIINTKGNMVHEVSGPDSGMSINLPDGLYMVEIYFKDGGSTIQKLIVK